MFYIFEILSANVVCYDSIEADLRPDPVAVGGHDVAAPRRRLARLLSLEHSLQSASDLFTYLIVLRIETSID